MVGSSVRQSDLYSVKSINAWFDEINLPVAPVCNMMCNFCSKSCDCTANGNNPEYLSRNMTPRQAVNWVENVAGKNQRARVIKISGPCEPLYNYQTFEVLKRLAGHSQDYILSVSTNGILLAEKADELARLNVKRVEVSINAISANAISRLYSRIVKDGNVIVNPEELSNIILNGQFEGIKACLKHGISVGVNISYFPGINDGDIPNIAQKCSEYGVSDICIIGCKPNGKFKNLRTPLIDEILPVQNEISKYVNMVGIKSFN
ncbi:MAG: radical SAM protein [Bacillota bacterium]|nr:radical SAM protein [Bacillota bacterium]